ncbi:putative transposase, Ptta/En/Spm, plant [Sesbania bispinosa]|nr:putative transposase, Ptta/En/Spm, plant [Sesbania bispinosa]
MWLEGQPVGDSGRLLTRFLGPIGRDFSYFPISNENWKKVPRDYKRIAFENDIEGKFYIHSNLHKSYVFKSLGLRWREHKQDLWHAKGDNTHTRDELIEKEIGRKVSRGEVWTTTHKRHNGTFVNDQAEEINVHYFPALAGHLSL